MEKLICKICKWVWIPRVEEPVKCPNCQSKKWKEGKNDKKDNK